QVLRTRADDDVARRARAIAAAGVLETEVEVLRDVEERLGFAVVRVRQLAVLELHGLLLAVNDEGNFRHHISLTFRPDKAACTERFMASSARCLVASLSVCVFSWMRSRSSPPMTAFSSPSAASMRCCSPGPRSCAAICANSGERIVFSVAPMTDS